MESPLHTDPIAAAADRPWRRRLLITLVVGPVVVLPFYASISYHYSSRTRNEIASILYDLGPWRLEVERALLGQGTMPPPPAANGLRSVAMDTNGIVHITLGERHDRAVVHLTPVASGAGIAWKCAAPAVPDGKLLAPCRKDDSRFLFTP
ncbi:hypothetical protein DSM104443_01760 [Usitatibacter rugosus]|uniref:Pilin n=1 Tax=Usitatibacter rugosus TaxID=2732067 RepID=A0A6M4GWG7_9PROT|nr:hypothetical protein [Usitatibacter rugosus]QJR10693.1 hypothetical protein DSM104443_01760 [Usitatibacter rugosus]